MTAGGVLSPASKTSTSSSYSLDMIPVCCLGRQLQGLAETSVASEHKSLSDH